MESGDGLIVRIHPSPRGLTAESLRTLAVLARAHGNGQLELTRRANLQLRGVRAATLPALQHALVERGLALPASQELARRLLLVDPLARNHDELVLHGEQLERRLALSSVPRALAAKIGVLFDGESGVLAAVAADVRVVMSASPSAEIWVAAERGEALLGSCAKAKAADVVAGLLAQLALADVGSRMRDVVAQRGLELLRTCVANLDPPASAGQSRRSPRAAEAHALGANDLLGFREEAGCFGLGVPFGAADAATFAHIAALSEQFGDGQLKLSPTRAFLLSGVAASAVPALTAAVQRAGLMAESNHLLANVVACAGAPACGSALGETRALARELAARARPLLAAGASLHVSGCRKGCACSGRADLTVLHDATGAKLGLLADVAETAALCASSAPASATLGEQLRALAHEYAIAAPREAASAFLARYRARLAPHELATKPSPMKRTYDYERNPAEIYRRSFAIIRSEAKLGRFSPSEERVAVRLIHTAGLVELADDIVFSPGFTEAASAALRAGKPILCDANMIVSGVTRARLSANNDVLCFLGAPGLAELARAQETTRSAAALTLWRERLDGAVVAIGNAPTALFRLLELLDESDVRPAAVIGVPVGFVGAAESKEALLADARVPSLIVRGRKGGSAMAVAAINALASEEE